MSFWHILISVFFWQFFLANFFHVGKPVSSAVTAWENPFQVSSPLGKTRFRCRRHRPTLILVPLNTFPRYMSVLRSLARTVPERPPSSLPAREGKNNMTLKWSCVKKLTVTANVLYEENSLQENSSIWKQIGSNYKSSAICSGWPIEQIGSNFGVIGLRYLV